MDRQRVAVLGAGLQGICAALALARRGQRVVLVDRAPDCMLRASLRNEGKIHVGFVYANDDSFRTPALMLESSMRFSGLLESWLGRRVEWEPLRSRPFVYALARDSMVPREDLLAFYERLQDAYLDMRGPGTGYLGRSPRGIWREARPGALDHQVDPGFADAFVETIEVAVDLGGLRELLRSAVHASDRIETLYDHEVRGVVRTPAGFRVEGERTGGGTWAREAGVVVNCLWDGRLGIDRQLGVGPNGRPWVYRLKYRLLADVPASLATLPSLTFVLGPYGDIVINRRGRIYVSWYPSCMRGWCDEISIPSEWEAICDGRVDAGSAAMIAGEALEQFGEVVPGLRDCEVDVVDGGVIFSWGESDIDDPASELHARHETGVHPHDGYFSIDTGKLTCAPLFAERLLEAM